MEETASQSPTSGQQKLLPGLSYRPRQMAALVVVVGLMLTVAGAYWDSFHSQATDQYRFGRFAERIKGEMSRRLTVYGYGLNGARSLFPASKSVERHEFAAMVLSRDPGTEFPGTMGIGYIARVKNTEEDVAKFLAEVRADGAPDFKITIPPGAAKLPDSVIDDRLIIRYIEPLDFNDNALGLDIGSHPVRREAAERAMLTNEVAITGRIELVQDEQKVAGFLIMLPVYQTHMPIDTREERIAAITGWTYMPLIGPTALESVVDVADQEVDFVVFDGETLGNDFLIYDSNDGSDATASHADEADLALQSIQKLQIGGRTWTVAMRSSPNFIYASRSSVWMVCVGGSILSLLLGFTVFMQRTATRRAHGMAQSMTRDLRRLAAEAETATQAKSEFLANMSHEIRTPMTAILGYADLLAEDARELSTGADAAKNRTEYVTTIKRNGNHLLTLINDILDLSKIEAGKMEIEQITMNPNQIVQDVISLMAVKAQSKALQLEAIYETAIPETIQCDPVRLRQILMNLVGNAIKFTEIGRVTMKVSCVQAMNQLCVEVLDTGCGMSPEQSQRLFGAFQQADTSTTRQFGGTGLGLHISKRLAKMLKGDIAVNSTLGHGSTFTLTLGTGSLENVNMVKGAQAIIIEDEKDNINDNETDQKNVAPLDARRILLAEDGPDNQRLISFILRKAGAEVTIVDNGKLAIEALTCTGDIDGTLTEPPRFDLLLTDMQMPEMDGYTSVALLRSKGCTLPIIALTAHAMAGDADKCLNAGCDDYATKPIDRARLIDACICAINKHARDQIAA